MRQWKGLRSGLKTMAYFAVLYIIISVVMSIVAPAKNTTVAPAPAPPVAAANVDPRVDWVKMPSSSPGNSVIGPVNVVSRCNSEGDLVTVVGPTTMNPSIAVLPNDPACKPSQDLPIP